MGVHSKRGPSKSKIFRNCAGCFAMADSVSDELKAKHGDAARLGTATHAVIEHCLKKGLEPEALRDRIVLVMETGNADGASILRSGAKMPKPKADEYVFIVDDDMIDSAHVATEYVRNRCEELGVSEDTLELETRTNPLPDRDDTSGTADVTIPAWPSVLEVADFKNGYIEVDHRDNDQARAYLTGKAIEADWSYETYRATIIQPNCAHEEGRIRWQEYTADELHAFEGEYLASILRCEKAEKAFPGEVTDAWAKKYLVAGEHCLFCEAGAACPARRKEAERLAKIEFADPPEEIQLPAVRKRGEVSESTEEQVGRILAWAPFLDQLVRAAQLYAHRAMEAGYEIPGQKLVAKRSVRKLVGADQPEEVVKRLVEGKFITNSDVDRLYTPRKLKSGPQIEKIIPKKKREAFNDEFLEKPDNGTTIAPYDDPRPSVEPRSIADDFDEDFSEEDFG